MADASLDIVVRLQDEANAKLAALDNKLKDISDTNNRKAGPSFMSMAAAVAAGQAAFQGLETIGSKIVGFMGSTIKEANAGAQAQAQLTAALKSTHGISGLYVEDLNDQAQALMNLTGVNDEAVNASQQMLLTFTNVRGGVFQQATESILDMSTAMNNGLIPSAEQLTNTTIQVGKALNDPINGINALRRVGVAFTDQQRAQIETLVKNNKTMEAQQIILNELSTEFGGRATAAGKTFQGQMMILSQNFDNFKQSVGTTILTAIQPFVEKLTAWAQTDQAHVLIENITNKVGQLTTQMLSWITNVAVPWVQQHWPQIKEAIHVTGIVINGFYQIIKFVFELIAANIRMLEALFENFFYAIMIGWAGLVKGIQTVKSWIQDLINWFKALPGYIASALSNVAGVITAPFKAGFDAVKKTFSSIGGGITGVLHTLHIPGFAEGVNNFGGGLAVVGERGPELVNLPRGSSVIPNNQLGNMGSPISINIYGNISTQNGTADIEQLAQRLGRMIQGARAGI